jgi:hypothetical protein
VIGEGRTGVRSLSVTRYPDLLALGECGTKACQDALLDALLLDDSVRPEVLAGLTRVSAPLAETVDRLLALDQPDLVVAYSTIGGCCRGFEVDVAGAADRIERLVVGPAGVGVSRCGGGGSANRGGGFDATDPRGGFDGDAGAARH